MLRGRIAEGPGAPDLIAVGTVLLILKDAPHKNPKTATVGNLLGQEGECHGRDQKQWNGDCDPGGRGKLQLHRVRLQRRLKQLRTWLFPAANFRIV